MSDLQQRLARLTPQQRAALEQQVLAGAGREASGIPRRPVDAAPLLSVGQERLWFLQRFDPGDASYNLHLTERLRGPVDADLLQRAADMVLERHEALRARFPMVDGRPTVTTEPAARLTVEVTSLEDEPPAEREARARRLVSELVNRPFQLDRAPLARLRLLRLGADDHVLCLATHHIVGDGWSLNVFARELSGCYAALRAGTAPDLPPLRLQYADFAAWQRERLEREESQLAERIRALRGRLDGAPPLDLPADRPRPRIRTADGGYLTRRLGLDLSARVAELAQAERATVFMALLAAYQVLLGRFSGQTDFCVGSPIAGRERAELQPLIGFFTNTLVVRADLTGDPSFRQLLGRVRAAALHAYADQDIPLERLIEGLDASRDTGRTPLFQAMFNLQPAKTGLLDFPETSTEPWTPDFAQVKADLELNVNQHPGELELEFGHSTALFEPGTVARMAGCLATLLAAATADPDRPISRLPMLDSAERGRLLRLGNDTGADYPRRRLHELIAERAADTPDAVAVVAGGRETSYRELDQRANRLAWRLREDGVPPGAPVGVLLPRDEDLIAGMLGVLKAGCHYVPLEPRHPADRLRQMLSDSNAAALIARREGAADLLGEALEPGRGHPGPAVVLAVDEISASGGRETPPEAPGSPEDLAYLIYTSGSTGRPKGVRVPHRGVVNLVADVTRTLALTPSDRFLFLTSVSFDIAALEIFAPLLSGGAAVVAEDSSVHAADQVRDLITRAGVTTAQAPPSVLEALLPRLPDGLPRVISGGEPLPGPLAERLLQRAGEVWNFYGPTETTIWSCRSRVRPGEPVTIGAPVANTEAHVLDRHLEPVPLGCVGELWLAGDGLARDYHASPALTASRFLPDPHGGRPGGRMYRTGDLARRRADGALEFLGRIDDQVKVGGVRIELGEVEAALASHPGVRRVAVTVRDDAPSGRGLVAYLDWAGAADPSEALRRHLRARLPESMIPAAFVAVDEFPTLASGKLNRAALPAPPRSDVAPSGAPPSTDSERLVAEIFSEVLGRDQVRADDDFFALGGNSLLAVKAVAELGFTTELEIPLRTVFAHRTVTQLAAAVEELLLADLEQLTEQEAARLVGQTPEDTASPNGANPGREGVR